MALQAIMAGWTAPVLYAVFGLYVLNILRLHYKLRQFRGSFWTAISNWPHSVAMLRHRTQEWYAEANSKYGPIARIAPNVLITSSYEVWMHVNNTPGYTKSSWYYNAGRLEYRRDNLLSQTDNEKHDARRKQLAPGYSGRENLHLESSIDGHLQELIDLLKSNYLSTTDKILPVDFARLAQFFTLDVISTVGLGKSFGLLAANDDVHKYTDSFRQGLQLANASLALGIIRLAHVPIIGPLLSPSTKDRYGFGKMIATCYRYVDDRASNPTDKRSDMLASFIRHGLNSDELRTESLLQIVAGSDTTSTALRGILMYTMTNARVYAKLQAEIDAAVLENKAPAAEDGIITAAQAKQLPYLQAVIREGLRLWPPASPIFARDTPPGGDTVVVDGESVFLPGSVCIGYSALGIQQNEKVFGADTKSFRPERWFEKDPDKLSAMTRSSEVTFGHGRWQCLGKGVAQIELSKTIFELFRHFDLAFVRPTKPWHAENNVGLSVISDMWVQVLRRAN